MVAGFWKVAFAAVHASMPQPNNLPAKPGTSLLSGQDLFFTTTQAGWSAEEERWRAAGVKRRLVTLVLQTNAEFPCSKTCLPVCKTTSALVWGFTLVHILLG
jgi:hypothetical protein